MKGFAAVLMCRWRMEDCSDVIDCRFQLVKTEGFTPLISTISDWPIFGIFRNVHDLLSCHKSPEPINDVMVVYSAPNIASVSLAGI